MPHYLVIQATPTDKGLEPSSYNEAYEGLFPDHFKAQAYAQHRKDMAPSLFFDVIPIDLGDVPLNYAIARAKQDWRTRCQHGPKTAASRPEHG